MTAALLTPAETSERLPALLKVREAAALLNASQSMVSGQYPVIGIFPRVGVYVWRPSDWDRIVETLR